MDLPRSFLFVPGDREERFAKAFSAGADAVIQDLEDAVSPERKDFARAATAQSLDMVSDVRRFVRINARETPSCWDDLHAVVRRGLDGIVLPKAESADDIAAIAFVVEELERRRGIEPGAIEIVPLVESARGIAALCAIAGFGPRVRRLTYGAVDLSTELSLTADADESEFAPLRWQLVVASRAARIAAPIDTVFIDVGNTDGLERSVERARRGGFAGKLCIHPRQVAAVNAGFSPGEAEISQARRIVALAAEAPNGAVALDGVMVDRPVVERARLLLRRLEQPSPAT